MSLCSWLNFEMGTQGDSKISFVSDINEENEELKCKKVGARFSCEATGMERFFQHLPRTVRRENLLWKRLWLCVEFVVAS